MAAYSSHSRGISRASLLNAPGPGEHDLPTGSCNFRDLSIGARAPACGCQRFWLNTSHLNGLDAGAERVWCFCGHHACFHNAFSQQQRVQEQAIDPSRVGEEHLIEQGYVRASQAQRASTTPPKPLAGLGIRPGSRSSQSQSINTRVWEALNDFARNQEDSGMSDSTSKLPSTAAPSVVEDNRLSPNRITQDRLQLYRPMGPPVNIPPNPAPQRTEEYSATEVATPSMAGTPDFQALAAASTPARVSPAHLRLGQVEPSAPRSEPIAQIQSADAVPPPQHQEARLPSPTFSIHDLQNIVRSYGQRLEVLESLSFSNVPIEELHERFELFDGRVLDLEQWRTEQEQDHSSPEPKPTGSKRRRLLPAETSSFASDGSFDSSAAAHTEAAVLATLAANAETHPRIDALESRVADLETASLPSFGRPWQVQVVLLPWGRDLRGIWFSSSEATQQSLKSATQASEEWTGASPAPKLSFKSSTSAAWTTESIEAWADEAQEWLSPKACGPRSTVFQRLASRGLVQDITLTSPDARHILNAIDIALGQFHGDGVEKDHRMGQYQALDELFIPIRKVRKSARLRFLSPAEMITSASWTAGFLDSSVFMKVNDGQRRLFVTTPEAYLQTKNSEWTWLRVKALSKVDETVDLQTILADDTAIESCWTYNEQLDRLPSLESSFASHESQWSTRSQADDPDNANIEQQPMSPRSEARPAHQRTISLPSSVPALLHLKEIVPKRRITSFENPATVAVYAEESGGPDIVAKRRRISHSPEAERRGVNFTPRLSREPPSPFTSEAAVEARSQGTGSRKRGNTPFAYATPHSNNNFLGPMEFAAGDGDTEANTDIIEDHSDRGEEEWEGVEDGNTNPEEAALSDGEDVIDEVNDVGDG